MKSKIFREISEEEARNIITHYFPSSSLVGMTLLKGGLFNTTYKLELTLPHRVLILRLGPVNREYLMPFENNLMQAEEYIYQLMTEEGIPCPVVVVCDTSRNIISRDFMITEFINSKPLSDEAIQGPDKDKLYKEAGEYTRRLHSIHGKSFGRASDYVAGICYATWKDFLISHVKQITDLCLEHEVFDMETVARINQLYESHQYLFDKVTEPRLTHADLWAGNILVKNDDRNEYKVAAVIDADRAVFGDIDFEFASPWMINDAFLSGYGNIDDSEDRPLRLKLYRLIYHIIDSYVWKVQYSDDNEYQANKERSLQIITSFDLN